MIRMRVLAATWAAAMAWVLSTGDVVGGPKPVKVGFSMALTGSIAVNGKQLLAALEIWRDDVNAHGGLLGRPVELVCYDDQSNPANVPSIYTKLISLDKVDLLIGPYATNMIAAEASTKTGWPPTFGTTASKPSSASSRSHRMANGPRHAACSLSSSM